MKKNFRRLSSSATALLLVLTLSGATPKKVVASDGEQSDDSIDPNPKHLPIALAAYVLHGRYIFGANGGQTWYYDKTVTVSGVVNKADVRLISDKSLGDRRYYGQYMIPLLGRKVIAIIPYSAKLLPLLSSSKHSRVDQLYIVKVTGVVKRSGHYQQVIIADAQLIKSRSLAVKRDINYASRKKSKRPTEKTNDEIEDGRITYSDFLGESEGLERWQWLILGHGVTRRICDMGADPEAYAAELASLKSNNTTGRKVGRILVSVSGISEHSGNTTRLRDCEIVGWREENTRELR